MSMPTERSSPTHIDDFIDDRESDSYAVFVFLFFRLPASLQFKVREHMKPHRLFCTYMGKRYRCTGASRMGDVWLADDFKRETGYDHRVDVAMCSEWGPTP